LVPLSAFATLSLPGPIREPAESAHLVHRFGAEGTTDGVLQPIGQLTQLGAGVDRARTVTGPVDIETTGRWDRRTAIRLRPRCSRARHLTGLLRSRLRPRWLADALEAIVGVRSRAPRRRRFNTAAFEERRRCEQQE
jgi:hypothetical protein